MPMTIRVALAETSGPPKGESFVTTCTLEFDDDPSPPLNRESVRQAVDSAVAVCCQVLNDELRRDHGLAGQARSTQV
jgi:hypothetical protein